MRSRRRQTRKQTFRSNERLSRGEELKRNELEKSRLRLRSTEREGEIVGIVRRIPRRNRTYVMIEAKNTEIDELCRRSVTQSVGWSRTRRPWRLTAES